MSELLDLPDHLINDILLHLPVKSIGRCNALHTLTFTTERSGDGESDGDSRKVKLPFGKKPRFNVVSSCHGLVLFSKRNGIEKRMVLMNLITLEGVKVPNCPFIGPCTYDLGYDATRDDYKIVWLSKYGSLTRSAVYSVGMKTWRRIKDFPYGVSNTPIHTTSGVFVNGFLHWTFSKQSRYVIAAFNWARNKVVDVPCPAGVEIDEIRVLEGCLAFVSETDCTIDVWVMKEYGVRDSWTKRSIIYPPEDVSNPMVYEVICVLNADEFVLLENGERLVAYNWRNGVRRDMSVTGVVEGFDIIMVFRESLLSPIY